MNANQEVGNAAYVVSVKWLRQYHDFLLYDQFDRNVPESKLVYDEHTHFSDKKPGPMNCREHLVEDDKNGENLFGTGELKGMDSEYVDTYIDTRHTAQT